MFKKKFRNESSKDSSTFLSILPKYLVATFAIITTLSVFIPLNPEMPHSGIDQSWFFSMNEAVAQNLKIGKEIIFTFGPYASIYTKSYHPATDNLMVYGSLLLGLCYSLSLLYLAKTKIYRLLAFFIFFACYYFSRDVLFYTYPLILVACASIFIMETDQHKNSNLNTWQILGIFVVFAPIGLIVLVKGSHLLAYATAVLISLYFLYHHHRKLALIALISPVMSTVIFWILSGQSLLSLPSYFVSMVPLISGYSEAMAVQGSNIEILAYLLAAIVILWILVNSDEITVPTKVFLSICFALFLFIVFKLGVVRPGGPRAVLGPSIVFAILIIGFIFRDKHLTGLLFITIITLAGNTVRYDPELAKEVQKEFGIGASKKSDKFKVLVFVSNRGVNTLARNIFKNILNNYAATWYGLRSRVTENSKLRDRFNYSIDEIRKEYAVPSLQGTTDIYSYGQSYLLASNNKWNPRPIIQSYSAYTPELAQINEQHLRGNSAPNNVLFCVQTIDEHLPSLDDGLSWPALFDNYTITKLDNDLAYLQKKQTIKSCSSFDEIHAGIHKTGECVVLSTTSTPIFAVIDLKLTLLGKLLSIVFKPSQLKLTLKLKDGTNKEYRVLSNMMKSGFFISPLVQNTKDFVLLATGNERYLKNSIIESIIIKPDYGSSILWCNTYALKLKAYRCEMQYNLPAIFFDSMSDSIPEVFGRDKLVE